MTVRIITDGSADLPKQLLEEWGIEQVPLTVTIDDEHCCSDMEAKQFYEKMGGASSLPATASPSPHAFIESFRKAGDRSDILVLTLTSQLSSTYQHAVLAQHMYQEEHGGAIEVIDTRTASSGLGVLVYRAAQMAKEGLPFKQLTESIKEGVQRVKTHVFLDSLENVIKGGRLDKVRGTIASILNVKLVLRATEEGTLEVMDKVRGSANALRKLVDRIEDFGHDMKQSVIAVAHSNCEEKAKELLETIKKRYPFKEAILADMGPVIGTYAGQGGILVAYV